MELRTCNACGKTSTESALTWSLERDVRSPGVEWWSCDECARANVRSIEAKLDPQFWSKPLS
ncbi:hypothetical protein EH165_09890 [Nakamurella antarctica]|uniref:Uncharacterized protein n=1 Tax=Nakamurella antarctica TaxID=1902245 RepID=A0A3G8ZM21_9ACTN|nr:hypothetical protein EH165_09890 [Nakamurella antarctica]